MNKKYFTIVFTTLLLFAATIAQARTVTIPVGTGQLVSLHVPAKTVMIANPSIADLQLPSPSTMFLFANKAGKTTAYALDENGHIISKINIVASHDIEGFLSTVKKELPHSCITARTLRGKLYVSGTVATPQEADMVSLIANSYEPNAKNIVIQYGVTMPTQVNIKVRFAEVSRNATEKLGLNWDSLGSISASTLFTGNFGSAKTAMGSNLGFSFTISQDAIFNALSGDGLLTTLAEPNLTVLSGKKATFNAGGQVPVSIPVAANQPAQIEYKDFGVLLSVEPTILSSGRISLHVQPEVSRVVASSPEMSGAFTFTRNSADTYVELADGQSFVLAGLFKNRENNLANRFPFLGDIPVLGALFRSTQYQKEETELVIICTVNLVKPGLEKDYTLPTDGVLTAPPFERLLFGRLQKRVTPNAQNSVTTTPLESLPSRPLEGKAGFYF